MHTYIFELDIIGLTPGSAFGRAAVYSAWVWRNFGPLAGAAALSVEEGVRRVVMAVVAEGGTPVVTKRILSPKSTL